MTLHFDHFVRCLAAAALIGATTHARAQPPALSVPASAPTSIAGVGNIAVTSTRIADLTPDGVTIAVEFSLTPDRTVSIESIRFSALRINGLPLHADPMSQLTQLPKGKATALPPLIVKVFFRDLTTVAPLRQMLTDQAVQIQGQANATFHATFIEKLALGTAHPIVMLPFTQKVPIALPDSPFARQAADAILNLVQAGLDSGVASANKNAFFDPDWIKTLKLQAPKEILEVETRYALEQDRTSYPIRVEMLAFQLAAGPILTNPEARTPWEYEPDFLARIQSGEARLAPQPTEVELHRVAFVEAATSSGTPLLLTHNDFTLQEQGAPEIEKSLVAERGMTAVKVRNRVAPTSLLTIKPQSPITPGWAAQGLSAAPPSVASQTAWSKVAVFRLIPTTGADSRTIELIQLSAHREGNLIHFDQPLDSAAFGSPVVAPEGVLGIVQDETTAALLTQPQTEPK
jgi:hypothetical protein